MQNLIFLDIDGVLNDNFSDISDESIEILKQLINIYGAKVIIISSLQINGTIKNRQKLQERLEKYGLLNIDFIDPNYEGEICNIPLPSRILGIIDYLKNNPVENYVILDDEFHIYYRLTCLNYFRTNPHKGLISNDLDKIKFKAVNKKIFNHVNYKYRQLGNYEVVTNNLIKVLKKITN